MKSEGRQKLQTLDPLFQLLSDPAWLQNFGQQKLSHYVNLSPESLRDQVIALSTGWDAVIKSVPSRIIALKRHSNSLLPIHRLPVEVLSEIFCSCLLPTQGARSYFMRRRRLMEVCTWWAEVTRKAPVLWSIICAEGSANHVSTTLARSSRLLSVDNMIIYDTTKGLAFPKQPKGLIEQTARWKSVALSGFEEWEEDEEGLGKVDPWSQLSFPELEEVSICGSEAFMGTSLAEVFDAQMPNVQHLRIEASLFSCTPTTLKGIRSLTIAEFTESSQYAEFLPSSMLWTALQSACQLQVLTLSNTDISCGHHPPDIEPITLPDLTTLVWVNGQIVDQEAFIAAVKMPRCSTILLHSNTDHSESIQHFPFNDWRIYREKEAVDRTLRRLVDQAVEANIVVHYGTLRRSFRFTTLNQDRSTGLDVQIIGEAEHEIDPSNGLAWAINVFGDKLRKTPISLKIAGIYSHLLNFDRIPKLSSIIGITFHDIDMNGPDPLLELLGQWTHDRSTNELRWPLPSLRSLTIRSSSSIIPLQLFSTIRDRYSLNQTRLPEYFPLKGTTKKYTAVLPARLHSIDIRYRVSEKHAICVDKEIGRRIRRYVGPGVFTQRLCPDDDRYSVYRTGDFDWSQFEDEPDDVRDEAPDNGSDGLDESDEETEDVKA